MEYKHSMSWKNADTRVIVIRAILGMSNIAGGGQLIIGVTEKEGQIYESTGMLQTDYDSYVDDDIGRLVSNYADKYATFEIEHVTDGRKRFIVFNISEFDEAPVCCKKSCKTSNGKKDLTSGRIYTRSHKIPETIEVATSDDMREIIELATDKGVRHFLDRASKVGLYAVATSSASAPQDDKVSFDKEIEDFK